MPVRRMPMYGPWPNATHAVLPASAPCIGALRLITLPPANPLHPCRYYILDAVVSVTPDMAATFASSPELLPVLAMPADIVNRFLATIKPYLVPSEAAYVNYQPPALTNFEEAYFGANAPRLRAIKAQYDPLGLFIKPYTVQGVPASSEGEGSSDGGAASLAPAPAPAPPPSGGAVCMRVGVTTWFAATLVLAAAVAALL